MGRGLCPSMEEGLCGSGKTGRSASPPRKWDVTAAKDGWRGRLDGKICRCGICNDSGPRSSCSCTHPGNVFREVLNEFLYEGQCSVMSEISILSLHYGFYKENVTAKLTRFNLPILRQLVCYKFLMTASTVILTAFPVTAERELYHKKKREGQDRVALELSSFVIPSSNRIACHNPFLGDEQAREGASLPRVPQTRTLADMEMGGWRGWVGRGGGEEKRGTHCESALGEAASLILELVLLNVPEDVDAGVAL